MVIIFKCPRDCVEIYKLCNYESEMQLTINTYQMEVQFQANVCVGCCWFQAQSLGDVPETIWMDHPLLGVHIGILGM